MSKTGDYVLGIQEEIEGLLHVMASHTENLEASDKPTLRRYRMEVRQLATRLNTLAGNLERECHVQ